MIYTTHYPSPLGDLLLAASDNALIGLWIKGQKYYLSDLKEPIEENNNLSVFHRTKEWLDLYFQKERPAVSMLKLAPIGSDFRQHVWKILCEIPYGQTVTYNDIAKRLARERGILKMSAQAVGGAVGHNPISIIIPCHRVVGSNGSLTGYAGGIDKKMFLLQLENSDVSRLYIPTRGTAL
jgi:methylated-DNA-[protein]-cysteine S-methyltransferase